MPDTIIGSFPGTICADCGREGVVMFHSGPLVLKGESGHFCAECADLRKKDSEAGREPKPIGYREGGWYATEESLPPGECSDCGKKGDFEFSKGFGHVSVNGRFCPDCQRNRIHLNMAGGGPELGDPPPIGYRRKKKEESDAV
jgi:hypothetical protein